MARPAGGLAPNATLEEREALTADVHRLVVRPDIPVGGFRAGQYCSIGLLVDRRPVLRPYSTATAPGPAPTLEFLVRRVEGGALTPVLWHLPLGGRLWLGPPRGLFALEPCDPRPHLLVATGTGLAPFVSMLDELAGVRAAPPVALVHGVATVPELAFRERLESWRLGGEVLRYEPTISRPAEPASAGWEGRTGRVETVLAEVLATLGRASDVVCYLCGNPRMIASATDRLLALGVPAGSIVTERYWAPEGVAA